jgi:superoxide dismutase, Fe-Mn family
MRSKLFSIIAVVMFLFSIEGIHAEEARPKLSMEYQAKDYSHLLGMPGFSDQLLKMHFQLYQGYVKNTNLLLNLIRDWNLGGKAQNYEYGAIKRRVAFEFDGMRLHELYFENLGGNEETIDKTSHLYQRVFKDFGSYDLWKKDFVATGMIRGIGWVVFYLDPRSGRLVNTWINDHEVGHLAGGTPLLVMDVWEHAYITQYGLDRAKYIDVFFENINWEVVSKRYEER